MALFFPAASLSFQSFSKVYPHQNLTNRRVLKNLLPMRCLGGVVQVFDPVERPFAKYQPTFWSYDFVKSLNSPYSDNMHQERVKKLEDIVRASLQDWSGTDLALLEFIDDMERLGTGYRFKNEIRRELEKIAFLDEYNVGFDDNLYATSLKFRLLRQHGFEVSQDVFKKFMDQNGAFRTYVTYLRNDVKGLLSLYEASFLAFEDENFLEDAKSFADLHLKNLRGCEDTVLVEQINHALELPLHRRAQRLEARWYIQVYNEKKNSNQLLLQLAVLDFNMVQSTLQRDLQHVSKWWKRMDLAGNLDFIRDRLIECFFFAAGVVSEPQDSKTHIGITKVCALITTIDDAYDEYGSLAELELFTYAVERWDINEAKPLPVKLKVCFLALYNTINEMVYDSLREKGEDISKTLTKAWADLCQTFLKEAKWNEGKFTPTFDDYLENAWRSVSGSLILAHAYFLTRQEITSEALDSLESYHDLLKWSSMIFRLTNDLATSKAEIERGKTVNAVSCYMEESGASEELSRQHIRSLIDEAWKKLNAISLASDSPFKKESIQTAINLSRIAQCTYQYGDGVGAPDTRANKRVLSLIIEPIAVMETKKQVCY